MENRSSSSNLQQTEGLVKGLLQHARLVWRLLRDRRVPGWLKLVPLAGLVYVLLPLDLIPDFVLPGLGGLDDLGVVLLSLKAFVELSPPWIVRQHLDEMLDGRGQASTRGSGHGESTLDVPYRIVGQKQQQAKERSDD